MSLAIHTICQSNGVRIRGEVAEHYFTDAMFATRQQAPLAICVRSLQVREKVTPEPPQRKSALAAPAYDCRISSQEQQTDQHILFQGLRREIPKGSWPNGRDFQTPCGAGSRTSVAYRHRRYRGLHDHRRQDGDHSTGFRSQASYSQACPGMMPPYSRDSGAGILDLREHISMRFKVRWILDHCASKIMMSSPAARSSRVSVFVAIQN
jgi:hypothetical protein